MSWWNEDRYSTVEDAATRVRIDELFAELCDTEFTLLKPNQLFLRCWNAVLLEHPLSDEYVSRLIDLLARNNVTQLFARPFFDNVPGKGTGPYLQQREISINALEWFFADMSLIEVLLIDLVPTFAMLSDGDVGVIVAGLHAFMNELVPEGLDVARQRVENEHLPEAGLFGFFRRAMYRSSRYPIVGPEVDALDRSYESEE